MGQKKPIRSHLGTRTIRSQASTSSAHGHSDFRAKHLEIILKIAPSAEALCALIILGALALLFVRASLMLESHWDSLVYHIPFAALRIGMGISYEMPIHDQLCYDGFPPLVSFLQGALWKITGSVNATGVVNALAFFGFLIYCHKILKAPFWIVGMIALSAPLVLIQMSTNYDDLCGSCFLAIGFISTLRLYLFPNENNRIVFLFGILGGIAAAWSKFILVPLDILVFVAIANLGLSQASSFKLTKQQVAVLLIVAALAASLPYIKNFILYKNPFWPLAVPYFVHWFPFDDTANSLAQHIAQNRPTELAGAPQFLVFLHSLFEINHPTHYSYRPRWIVDQGNAWIAFRSGGFWAFGVGAYLFCATALLMSLKGKRGAIASIALIGLICSTGLLPQSNELRYYQFIPLLWATVIGMLYPSLKQKKPIIAMSLLAILIGLYGYMVSENLWYYTISPTNLQDIAGQRGIQKWWDTLEKGKLYCTVGIDPNALLLTGPSLTQFRIVDRDDVAQCPQGSLKITNLRGPIFP